jgi:hypothetical protein
VALAFDAVGPSSAGTAGTSASLSWSHTVTGAGNVLLAAVACDNDPATITGVTWGAVPMTPLAAGSANYIHSNGMTAGWIAVYKLVNAAAGTANITATLSAASAAEGGSLSFSGADTVTGISARQTATGAGTPATCSFTPTTSGNIVAAFLVNGNFISSATSPSTSRFVNNTGGSNAGGHIAGATSPSTGSAVTTAWTVTADWYAVIAVEVLAGGGVTVNTGAAAGTGAALNPAILTSNVNVGPRYATTASDLGGGQGFWNTPQYAEGGP